MAWVICSVQVCGLDRAQQGRLIPSVWCCLWQHSWEPVDLPRSLCLSFPEVMPPINGKLSWSCGSWSCDLGLLELLYSVMVDFLSEPPKGTMGTSVPTFLSLLVLPLMTWLRVYLSLVYANPDSRGRNIDYASWKGCQGHIGKRALGKGRIWKI